jgi:glycogen synthase
LHATVIRILTIGMGWFADEPGGLNRMYAGLMASMVAPDVRVRGLVAGNSYGSVALPDGLSFFERRDAPTLQRLRACRRAVTQTLSTENVDVVAAHFSLYALPVLDLLRKRPFIFHFHGPWAGESRAEGEGRMAVGMKRLIESQVYRRADRFITLSSAFAGVLQRQFAVGRDRIFVIPGGVDASLYVCDGTRREARARLGLPLDRPLVVSVRRLVHRVGLEDLIDAMVQVRNVAPEALLLIAGRGERSRALAARIVDRGLRDHVQLLGFVPDSELPMLYHACDLSVVPSVALEGFGLPTVESLAAGTPVLVTPVGGLPETVSGLDPALVLPGCGSAVLADAIGGALRNPGALPSAEACARYVRENFDWPVIAGKVLAVYRS